MAIRLLYQVPAAPLAEVSQQVGEGQYAQQQAELARQQENFDRQFGQRQQEFAAEQDYRKQIAALQDMQQRRSLGAQMYQFEAGRQDQFAGRQLDAAAELQKEEMRQAGFDDMRTAQADLQTQELQSRERMALTERQSKLRDSALDRRFNLGLASAENLEKIKNTLAPEQYQQAREQWDAQFKDTVGGYPFMAPEQPDAPPVTALTVKQSMQSMLGSAYLDGMEGFMGHEENGQWVWDLEPQQRAQIMLGLKKDEADRIKLQETEGNKLRIAELKEQQTAVKDTSDKQLKFKQAQTQNDQSRIKYVIDNMRKLERRATKTDPGYKPTDADRKRLMDEAELMYPDLTPDLYGL